MCGICGVLGRGDDDVSATLERLTQALHHRGPDGKGFRYLRGRSAGFGHRRLSIVDLATGQQPMANEDESVWVTYNGEIYNHLELRRELAALGHRFRTNADTEVLVHGFEQWGRSLFGRLNGIYAFALFDGRSPGGEVWLVRDPVGAKPLYVGRSGDVWWFSSELAAARECGLVASELRPEALAEFLVYRFVPSPATPFRDAWKVPPGHCSVLRLAQLPREPGFERFDPRFAPAVVPGTEEEWGETLRAELTAAIRRQLMSDVPVGALLSGGVDSTAVTRVMRDAMAQPPQTFGIGFPEDSRGEGSELPVARRAAAALGVPLKEVSVSPDPYRDAWLQEAGRLGEPIADSSSLLIGLLCETVHQSHKVVLTGQGADEPLGGYPRHVAERFYPAARLARPLLAALPERLALSDRVARMRRIAAAPERARRFAEILAIFSPQDAANLTRGGIAAEQCVAPVARWLDDTEDDSLNALLRVDARLSLADDLLIVADHMSMRSSVELRVPFLDLQLLALLERMPSRYKVSALGERKWLYRRAVRPLLPEPLRADLLGWEARTGRKLGLTTPVDRWFERWIERDAETFLLGGGARSPGYLKAEWLEGFLDRVRRRGLPRGRQLMSLFVLESWLRALEPAGRPATPSGVAA